MGTYLGQTMYVIFAFANHTPVQLYRRFHHSYTAEEGLPNVLG